MNITLSPQHEKLVKEKVRSGEFKDAEAVIAHALDVLTQQDLQQLGALRENLRHATEQVERGEYSDYDEHNLEDLADGVKRRGRERLAKLHTRNTG